MAMTLPVSGSVKRLLVNGKKADLKAEKAAGIQV